MSASLQIPARPHEAFVLRVGGVFRVRGLRSRNGWTGGLMTRGQCWALTVELGVAVDAPNTLTCLPQNRFLCTKDCTPVSVFRRVQRVRLGPDLRNEGWRSDLPKDLILVSLSPGHVRLIQVSEGGQDHFEQRGPGFIAVGLGLAPACLCRGDLGASRCDLNRT